jgi:hypothetical protein
MHPEDEFVMRYDGPAAKKAARALYRAEHPTGMHTNGMTWVRIEASHLHVLLSLWKASSLPQPGQTSGEQK